MQNVIALNIVYGRWLTVWDPNEEHDTQNNSSLSTYYIPLWLVKLCSKQYWAELSYVRGAWCFLPHKGRLIERGNEAIVLT